MDLVNNYIYLQRFLSQCSYNLRTSSRLITIKIATTLSFAVETFIIYCKH